MKKNRIEKPQDNVDVKLIKGETRKKGATGENLAVKALRKHNYKIIARNFSCHFGEVDIVATQKDFLVFVEVKAREKDTFGLPREAVNLKKQQKIIKTAQLFILQRKMMGKPVRFDVVEVLDGKANIIVDAFRV